MTSNSRNTFEARFRTCPGTLKERQPERPLQFSRGDFVENGRGVCRLGAGLAREPGQSLGGLREAVGPHAEPLAREPLKASRQRLPMSWLARVLAVGFDAFRLQRQIRHRTPIAVAIRCTVPHEGYVARSRCARVRMAPYQHRAPPLS